MNKKGISTVVATVLIVLITVAAVTILWAAISPMIDQNLGSTTACFDAQNSISVDSNTQYTCYNNSATNTAVKVRIERGANSEVLQGYEIIVVNNGASLKAYNSTSLPTENGGKVVIITSQQLGATNATLGTVTVSVAPRISIEGEVKSCQATAPIQINLCS